MAKKKNKEVLYRDLILGEVNIDEGTVEVAFASDTPVLREYGYEVLNVKSSSMNTDRIERGGIPVLVNHDRDKLVGRVVDVNVSDGVARAKLKFSSNPYAQEILRDIEDGIRPGISFGYVITKEEKTEETRDGYAVYRIDEYEVYEVSSVSIPADPDVGVGRELEQQKENITIDKEIKTMTTKEKVDKIDIKAVKREAAKAEQTRVRELTQLGTKFEMTDEAEKYIDNDKSVDEFRTFVLENMKTEAPNSIPLDIRASNADAEPELEKFEFMKAVRAAWLSGDKYKREAKYEIGLGNELAQEEGITPRGVYIPYKIVSATKVRDMLATTGGQGQELVGTDHLGGSFIDTLENKLVVKSLGATVLGGLIGNIQIPKKTSGATSYWLDPENSDITESNVGTGQVTLSPKDIGAYVDVSRRLLIQSSPDAQSMVQQDIAFRLAEGMDLACLYGTGANGQPTGIANTSGVFNTIGSPSTATKFAAADPTFAELVGMQATIAGVNAEKGGQFLGNEAQKHRLRAKTRDAGSGLYVVENGAVDGYNFAGSNQVTDGDVFYCGNWSDLLIGMWGGLDLIVDVNTGSAAGTTRLVVFQTCDVAVRHPESFIVVNDDA